MTFSNPPASKIAALLRNARTIAVVGLSDRPERPSFGVAQHLQRYGYRIIPVSPALTVWQGLRAIPDLDHLPEVLAPGERVDIVDVFRQARFVAGLVDDCLRLKLPTLWLQLGVIDDVAAARAVAGGVEVVMDKCIYVERARCP